MGFECLRIVLTHDSSGSTNVYHPGQVVFGTVNYKGSEAFKIDYGPYLEIIGHAEVGWWNKEVVKEKNHWSEEIYFNKIYLLDSNQTVSSSDTNDYRFRFSLQLPDAIPSSFEGRHGRVRYKLRATVQRVGRERDTCEVPLMVRSVVDLNTVAQAMVAPRSCKTWKNSFCSGPIKAVAWLDHSGYTPGETIVFNSKIENFSGTSIDSIVVQFIMREKFIADTEALEHERILFEHRTSPIDESKTHISHQDLIQVPHVPPSDLPYCNIIKVSYEIRWAIHSSMLPVNLLGKIAVLIGTVPLNRSYGINNN